MPGCRMLEVLGGGDGRPCVRKLCTLCCVCVCACVSVCVCDV